LTEIHLTMLPKMIPLIFLCLLSRHAALPASSAEGKMAGWLKALLLDHVQLCEDDRVLDVACGTGKLLDLMSQKTQIRCYGVDISEGMIQTASNNHPRMEFRNSDCTNIPYSDQFFDLITNNAAYHHFTNPSAFAKEAYRVLKTGGCLCIVEIRLPFFLRKLSNCIFKLLPTGDVKVYTAQEIADNFVKVGFHVSNLFVKGPIQLICFLKMESDHAT
jgi:ubiquinone/menaquinone biosynthesis C-methylase UbiE